MNGSYSNEQVGQWAGHATRQTMRAGVGLGQSVRDSAEVTLADPRVMWLCDAMQDDGTYSEGLETGVNENWENRGENRGKPL